MKEPYNERPTICILYRDDGISLRQVKAGIEEEGLFYTLQQEQGDCVSLGLKARKSSALGVGIGIDAMSLTLFVDGLEKPLLTMRLTSSNGRQIGSNAARYIKGLPLK